jgi:hypothetical protein
MTSFLRTTGAGHDKGWLSDQLSKDVLHVLEASGVPTVRQALPRFSAELERARRYMRPLTIVVLGPASADDEMPSQNELLQPAGLFSLLSALVASAVREALRETDIVSYAVTRTRCVIGMPEVDLDDARLAVERLQRLCAERHLPALRVGIALFPKHGWTLEELLRHAESAGEAIEYVPADDQLGSLDR